MWRKIQTTIRWISERALFWEKVDFTDYVPLVPTSFHTGDGMGDLISLLVVTYSQRVLAPKLMLSEEQEAVVLEVSNTL